MLTTPLCRQLGIEHPILNAPMGGGIAGPELAAAVSNAGGLGTLGLVALPPQFIGEQIRRTRALTGKPFLANLVVATLRGGEIDACFDAGISMLGLFGGDPQPFVADAHRRGIRVIPQVASVAEAVAAAEAGVDAVIAQGMEAGGHVLGTTSLSIVLPAIVDAVRPLPVIAAGGIADGRGLAAALALGAQAVSMGTRFLASDEAAASRAYKERITLSRAEDTVLTWLSISAGPMRLTGCCATVRLRSGRTPVAPRPESVPEKVRSLAGSALAGIRSKWSVTRQSHRFPGLKVIWNMVASMLASPARS